MSTTTWKPKPGDPRPLERYTRVGPHAFIDEAELALRREAWHAMNNAPPPDPEKDDATGAGTAVAPRENTTSDPDAVAPIGRYAHGPAADEYAIDWALAQDAGKPGPKLVLLILAWHCFNPGDTLAWPSADEIGEKANMGGTAVFENLQRLEALGLIHDSGQRRGRTGQIVVWRLGNSPESESLKQPDSVPLNSPESGPLGGKGSGFRAERVRNPDTEYPLKGGGGGAAGADGGLAPAAAAAPRFDLPGGLDPELFALWVDGRPERAVQKLIAEGRVLAAGGADLNALCRRAISERWKMWPKVSASSKSRVKKARPQAADAPRDWTVV